MPRPSLKRFCYKSRCTHGNFRHLSPCFNKGWKIVMCFFWFRGILRGVGQRYWCGWSHFGRTSFWQSLLQQKIVVLSCFYVLWFWGAEKSEIILNFFPTMSIEVSIKLPIVIHRFGGCLEHWFTVGKDSSPFYRGTLKKERHYQMWTSVWASSYP